MRGSQEPEPRRPWLAGAMGIIALALVVGAVWLMVTGGGSPDPAPIAITTSTEATTTSATIELAAFSPDVALLSYPTLLPVDWELCRQLEDATQGDSFCDQNDADSWVEVAVKDAELVRLDRAQTAGDGHGGMWLERSRRAEVAYPAGFHTVVVSTRTLDDEPLLEIAGSIPLVGNRDALYGSYELPLGLPTITDEQLASLLGGQESPARVTGRRDLEAQVSTATTFLLLFFGDGFTVPDFGPSLPFPRLVAADRPLVVGHSPSRGRVYAVWDQRGYGWRLEAQGTAEEISTIALDVIGRIAALDTE